MTNCTHFINDSMCINVYYRICAYNGYSRTYKHTPALTNDICYCSLYVSLETEGNISLILPAQKQSRVYCICCIILNADVPLLIKIGERASFFFLYSLWVLFIPPPYDMSFVSLHVKSTFIRQYMYSKFPHHPV